MLTTEKTSRYFPATVSVVGDEAWRDEVLTFMMVGLRPVDIEYFTSEEEVREWLPKV